MVAKNDSATALSQHCPRRPSDSRNVAHQGLLHLPTTYPDRLRGAARELRKAGLRRVASAVDGFAATLGPDPGEDAVQAWVDAYLRVDVALDLC